ncbi:hypothetical protein COL05_15780 [Bacillus sp. AFS059628]|uniref:hypothetical protein n=1 Tax=Bacillus sp. AFS059628 TaxID=2033508 RepID=UPI000BF6BBF7|nr:hypothetical protein [Bacillus sp. AFS059628]PFV80064.1 hypothetical protein COL05_15780 [Bacillus sp. AFS059628]
MPSIKDVADQINSRLNLIATNTANIAKNTSENLVVSQDIRKELNQTNGQLLQIDNKLDVGFASLSQGLFAMLQVQHASLELLDYNRQQNDTIICELVNNNKILCNIMRKLSHQLQMSEKGLESVVRIEGITERIHSSEAVDYDRHHELNKKIEQCCPPKPIPEEECPEVCETPIYRERKLEGQDWKPLPKPQRPDQVR